MNYNKIQLTISTYKFYVIKVLRESHVGNIRILSMGRKDTKVDESMLNTKDREKSTFYAIPPKMDGIGGGYLRNFSIDELSPVDLDLLLGNETRDCFSNVHLWICQIPENATYYKEGKFIYSNVIIFQNEMKSPTELELLKRLNKKSREKYINKFSIHDITELQLKDNMIKKETNKSHYIAIDFETSQATGHPRACQIGLTPIINGEIMETKVYLIKPPGNMYDERTMKVHHITPEITANALTFGELWPIIKSDFDHIDAIIAHNASTEKNVLRNEFADYCLGEMNYKFIDTLDLYREKYNKGNLAYRLGLENLCHAFCINTSNHHDAGDDSRNCAIIYMNYVNGIEPDMEKLGENMYEKSANSGQFKSKEEFSLADFIDINSVKPIYESELYGKRIIVTREFTIYGKESKNSEDIIRDYLHLKFRANTKKGDVNGTTDYVFVGSNIPEDWNKGKLKKVKEFMAKGSLKRVFFQRDIDKLFEQEKKNKQV